MKRIFKTILSVFVLLSCSTHSEDTRPLAAEVILDQQAISLDEGQTWTLTASILPATASQNIVWTVLDERVANVAEGVVTAVKAGITYVVATSEDGAALASCLVDVKGEHSYEEIPGGAVVYITKPEDLVNLVGNETATQVFLMNDLDMTGVEYQSSDFNFEGLFEGNGHSITGLDVPLFNNLRGSVKNLTLTSDVVYSVAGEDSQTTSNNPYGIGLLAHYIYLPDQAVGGVMPVVSDVTVNGSLTVDIQTELTNYNIGGISGASNGVPFVRCTNNAIIRLGESFSAKTVRVGGIAGIIQTAATADLNGCVNTGDIMLDAQAVEGDLLAGGIVGVASQAVEINECQNSANVSISGNVMNVHLAGVVGLASANVSLSSSSNSGELSLSDCYVEKQFFIGGVMAEITNKTENTYEALANTGRITVRDITTVSKNTSFAYIGGIAGCSDGTGKTFRDCVNKADVDARVDGTPVIPFKCRIGGIAGIINRNPEGCRSEGDISFKGNVAGCHIGGIAGYLNIAEYSNMAYKGTIWTNGTTGTNYTGGLIGNVNGTVNADEFKVFSNCSIYGSVHGANSNVGVAGLFCNSEKSIKYLFDSCAIGVGSVRKSSNDGTKDDTVTSDDHITGDVLIGGKGFSICNVVKCVVVEPDAI